MIAALFVEKGGVYYDPDLAGKVDPWPKDRDARLYAGPWPVVAHPPCERWGRYWGGGPMLHGTPKQRRLGDDGGCFASALESVRRWGGVLEHPEASHAFRAFGLGRPERGTEWTRSADRSGWICSVEQGNYGHRARKATWLYASASLFPLPALHWGAAVGERLDEGFHSNAERAAARAAGNAPVKRLSATERLATPPAFRDLLLSIARSARPATELAA